MFHPVSFDGASYYIPSLCIKLPHVPLPFLGNGSPN